MRSFWKIMAILALVGVCFCAVGFATGANRNGFYIDRSGLQMNSKEYSLKQEKSIGAVSEIYVDVLAVDVRLAQAEDYGLEIYSRDDSDISYTQENGKLFIKQGDNFRNWRFNFMSFDIGLRKEYITIYLPEGAFLDAVDIKYASGRVNVDALKCKAFNLKQLSGDTVISNFNADEATMNTSSGSIELRNSKAGSFNIKLLSGSLTASGLETKGLKAELTSGDTVLSGVLTGSTQINTISGNVKLEIQGQEQQYNRNIEILSGRVKVNGSRSSAGSVNYSADNILDINVTSGNVDITFIPPAL